MPTSFATLAIFLLVIGIPATGIYVPVHAENMTASDIINLVGNTTNSNSTSSNTANNNTTDSNSTSSNTANNNTTDSNSTSSNTANNNTTDSNSTSSLPPI